jgi:hypothetical protein
MNHSRSTEKFPEASRGSLFVVVDGVLLNILFCTGLSCRCLREDVGFADTIYWCLKVICVIANIKVKLTVEWRF